MIRLREFSSTTTGTNTSRQTFSSYHLVISQLARQAREALLEVFDIYTVAEWTEQKVLPMYKELARIKAEADALKKRRTWPARPFEVSPELAALGIVAR